MGHPKEKGRLLLFFHAHYGFLFLSWPLFYLTVNSSIWKTQIPDFQRFWVSCLLYSQLTWIHYWVIYCSKYPLIFCLLHRKIIHT